MAPEPLNQPLPFSDPPVLEVRGQFWPLKIVPVAQGEAPFLETGAAFAHVVRPVVSKEGDVVHVRLEMAKPLSPLGDFGPTLHAVLHVPAHVRASVHLDAGWIKVRGLSNCELDLQTGVGVTTLEDVSGKIRLQTGTGKISGEGVSGAIDVETNAGAVRLGLGKLTSGRHRVHSSMGAVRIDLAPGQKVQVDARASMGSVRGNYPSSPGAEAILDAQTELGSVRVDEAGAGGSRREREHGFGGWAWQWPAAETARRWGFGQGPFPPFSWGWPPRPKSEPSGSNRSSVTDEEMHRILTLVKDGKLTPEEAQKLIRAMEGNP